VVVLSGVAVLDSTGALLLLGFARDLRRQGAIVHIAGARASVANLLAIQGAQTPDICFSADAAQAVAAARRALDGQPAMA
jgi:anti-anti-sigma regulatory factor